MKNKLLVLPLLMLLLNLEVISQPLYKKATIFFTNQEILEGELNYTVPWNPILKKETFKYVSLKKKSIAAYEFENGRRFEKHHIAYADSTEEEVFGEVLFNGTISLFNYKGKLFIKVVSVDHLVQLTERNSNGMFSLVMAKHPELIQKARDMKFKIKNILSLLEEYHKIESLNYKNYGPNRDKVNIGLVAFYGFSQRSFTMKSVLEDIRGQDNSEPKASDYSFFIELTIPKLSRHLAFTAGYESVKEIQFDTEYFFSFDFDRIDPLNFRMDITNLFFGSKFYLPSKFATPYIGAGVVKTFIDQLESNYSPDFSLTDNYFGYYLNGGVFFDINKTIKPGFEIRYDKIEGSIDRSDLTNLVLNSAIKNFQFNIGVKISLFPN